MHDLAPALQVWIGYTDRVTEGTYFWVAGDGLHPNTPSCFWTTGEPSSAGGDNCVVELGNNQCGDWFSRNCGELKEYVCEYDGVAADPGTD